MAKLKEGSVIWNPVTKEVISKIATEEYVKSYNQDGDYMPIGPVTWNDLRGGADSE